MARGRRTTSGRLTDNERLATGYRHGSRDALSPQPPCNVMINETVIKRTTRVLLCRLLPHRICAFPSVALVGFHRRLNVASGDATAAPPRETQSLDLIYNSEHRGCYHKYYLCDGCNAKDYHLTNIIVTCDSDKRKGFVQLQHEQIDHKRISRRKRMLSITPITPLAI